jgi:hypothetical protein
MRAFVACGLITARFLAAAEALVRPLSPPRAGAASHLDPTLSEAEPLTRSNDVEFWAGMWRSCNIGGETRHI